jgi:alpha-tubulin suppressor-like RCC1 family protein
MPSDVERSQDPANTSGRSPRKRLMPHASIGLRSIILAGLLAGVLAPASHAAVSGQVFATGYNYYGQLGVESTESTEFFRPVSGLSNVTQVAPGDDATLFLTSGGTVEASGFNESGELGDGTVHEHNAPETVPGLSGVTAVASGGYHSLALLTDGQVKAWGSNDAGQVGDGGYGGPGALGSECECVVTPTTVENTEHREALEGVTAITAGWYVSYARLSSGRVASWGSDEYDELGFNSEEVEEEGEQEFPGLVEGIEGSGYLEHVAAISAGGYGAEALLENGTVVTWGDNEDYQLGTGVHTSYVRRPTRVVGIGGAGYLEHVVAIAAGAYFDLAQLANGTVVAWGDGYDGELGNGSYESSDIPVVVPGRSGPIALTAGDSFGEALLAGGALDGWGSNFDGELGDGLIYANTPKGPTAYVPPYIVGLGHGSTSYASFVIQGAIIGVASSSISYPGLALQYQNTQNVTVQNTGLAPLVVSGAAISGSAEFTKGKDGCTGTTLAAGATCTIAYTFKPTVSGEATATVSIASNAANPAPIVKLTGTGVPVPMLSKLSLSKTSFRSATAGATIQTAAADGTVTSYDDSQASVDTFTVYRQLTGVAVGHGRCVAPSKHVAKGTGTCTYSHEVGTFIRVDTAGRNTFRFSGRLGGHALSPGTFRLTAVAKSAGGYSVARSVGFKVARG